MASTSAAVTALGSWVHDWNFDQEELSAAFDEPAGAFSLDLYEPSVQPRRFLGIRYEALDYPDAPTHRLTIRHVTAFAIEGDGDWQGQVLGMEAVAEPCQVVVDAAPRTIRIRVDQLHVALRPLGARLS